MSRYIDADELSRKIVDEYHGSYSEVQIAPYQIDRMIDAQPTVDAARVVHAHWIKSNYDNIDGTIYKCSNCNNELFSAWNYCPHCGAKMDEDYGT